MAHFQYRGADRIPIRGARVRLGVPIEVRVPLQDGTLLVLRPRDRARGFTPGEPLEGGARHRRDPATGRLTALESFDEDRPGRGRHAREITDPRALRHLRADPRFTETP